MRVLAILTLVLALAACDRGDASPAQSGFAPTARGTAASGATTVAAATTPEHSCGGSCGGACGGGAIAEAAADVAVPADAVWTELHVTGMTCDRCAARVKGALAKLDGVLGVEVDLATERVRVATIAGADGRGLARPAIDALGYKVQ